MTPISSISGSDANAWSISSKTPAITKDVDKRVLLAFIDD